MKSRTPQSLGESSRDGLKPLPPNTQDILEGEELMASNASPSAALHGATSDAEPSALVGKLRWLAGETAGIDNASSTDDNGDAVDHSDAFRDAADRLEAAEWDLKCARDHAQRLHEQNGADPHLVAGLETLISMGDGDEWVTAQEEMLSIARAAIARAHRS